MFGFQKKEKKPLFIKAKDVISIIKSDYDDDMAFCLIEFLYKDKKHTMGSCVKHCCEECKENIQFVFDDSIFTTFDAFVENAKIENIKISEMEDMIEIIRAGIIDGEAALKTPWGDKRLAEKAVD